MNNISDNTFAKDHDPSFGEALHLHLHDIVQGNQLTELSPI